MRDTSKARIGKQIAKNNLNTKREPIAARTQAQASRARETRTHHFELAAFDVLARGRVHEQHAQAHDAACVRENQRKIIRDMHHGIARHNQVSLGGTAQAPMRGSKGEPRNRETNATQGGSPAFTQDRKRVSAYPSTRARVRTWRAWQSARTQSSCCNSQDQSKKQVRAKNRMTVAMIVERREQPGKRGGRTKAGTRHTVTHTRHTPHATICKPKLRSSNDSCNE